MSGPLHNHRLSFRGCCNPYSGSLLFIREGGAVEKVRVFPVSGLLEILKFECLSNKIVSILIVHFVLIVSHLNNHHGCLGITESKNSNTCIHCNHKPLQLDSIPFVRPPGLETAFLSICHDLPRAFDNGVNCLLRDRVRGKDIYENLSLGRCIDIEIFVRVIIWVSRVNSPITRILHREIFVSHFCGVPNICRLRDFKRSRNNLFHGVRTQPKGKKQ